MNTTTTDDQTIPGPRVDAAAQGAVDTVIDEACRALHLPTIRARYSDIAAGAVKERSSYKDFLADLLEAERAEREERRKARLVREANFPRPKRLEDFDFEKNPNVTAQMLGTLAEPDWVNAGQPLCLIGDSGTGKSHLLIGVGTAIAEARLKVRYTTTVNLVNELAEASDEKKLARTIARYGRVDLLCLDLCRDRDYADSRLARDVVPKVDSNAASPRGSPEEPVLSLRCGWQGAGGQLRYRLAQFNQWGSSDVIGTA